MSNTKRLLLISALCAFTVNFAQAQWQAIGPSVDAVYSLAGSGATIYAGTNNDYIYYSNDNGDNWTDVSNQQSPHNDSTDVRCLAINDDGVFAGSFDLNFSPDNGSNWNFMFTGDPGHPRALAVNGNDVFYGTEWPGVGTVYLTSNNGQNWTNTQLGEDCLSLAVSGTTVYAGTNGLGVYKSTNNGGVWAASNTGLSTGSVIRALAADGTNVYAATEDDGVFFSSNSGASWTQVNTGLPDMATSYVNALAVSGTYVFAGVGDENNVNGGVYLSTDNGANWQAINTGLPADVEIASLTITNATVFAGTGFGDTGGYGVYRRSLANATGIENVTTEKIMSVYPNPAGSNLTLETLLTTGSAIRAEIKNNLGQTLYIFNEKANSGLYKKTIDVNLAQGIYYLTLHTSEGLVTKKIEIGK